VWRTFPALDEHKLGERRPARCPLLRPRRQVAHLQCLIAPHRETPHSLVSNGKQSDCLGPALPCTSQALTEGTGNKSKPPTFPPNSSAHPSAFHRLADAMRPVWPSSSSAAAVAQRVAVGGVKEGGEPAPPLVPGTLRHRTA